MVKILLKLLSRRVDEGDMEPLDPRPRGATMPPPVGPVASATPITTQMPVTTAPTGGPAWSAVPPTPTSRPEVAPTASGLRSMAPWRIAGAVTLVTAFALMGWQAQRLVDDRPWSDALMWATVAAGSAAALCVLMWTRAATQNARRLVGPAARENLPDPTAAMLAWVGPFVLVAIAAGIVAVVGARTHSTVDSAGVVTGGDSVSVLPLAIALVALLLAIPMTYRPLHQIAGAVRQMGGYTVQVAQWMWVPVVMAVVGVASIAALRFSGVEEMSDIGAADAAGWAPLWVVAVVAAAPCAVTVLLAWRAASSVEDAIGVAASRRRPGAASPVRHRQVDAKKVQRRVVDPDRMTRIDLVPGAEPLRLGIVTLMAGLALLSVVGAVVTGMLWLDSRDAGVPPGERQRTWDILDALRAASAVATLALLVAVAAWTFVTVLNVRMTSGRRRNPAVAALAWPAAAGAIWWIADRQVVDGSVSQVMLGFVAQAAALAVPFLVLERSADAVGARRTPLRIVYVLGVVLLVQVQGLGGLSRLPDSITTTDIGRLAGYLAIGALIQLCSTLAVTEACRSMSLTTRHEADHHNMLVGQRSARSPEPAVGR